MYHRLLLSFFVLCFLRVVAAGAVESNSSLRAPSLQDELMRLEGARRLKTITGHEIRRLVEIYFLTSRCGDIKGLKSGLNAVEPDNSRIREEVSLLLCACGEKCGKESAAYSKLSRFRELFLAGKRWESREVQVLWRSIREMPEARYWALKMLRRNHDYGDHMTSKVRMDLERSLESLGVN